MLLSLTIRPYYLRVKKIKTNQDAITDYFKNHQAILEKNYPGIKPNRLLDEFLSMTGFKKDGLFFYANHDFFGKVSKGIPLEYINENAFFFKHNFYVNEDVLIPRSETEILVENAVHFIKKNYSSDFSAYEVGVGSGAISLSILSELDKPIALTACDISEKALNVAKVNHFRLKNNFHSQTSFSLELRDRLDKDNGSYNLIVSNPPYIPVKAQRKGVHHQVDMYEPYIALYLDDDKYDSWFKTFFDQVSKRLRPHGMFMMEGHEDYLEDLMKIGQNIFSQSELINDYTGAKRFLHFIK